MTKFSAFVFLFLLKTSAIVAHQTIELSAIESKLFDLRKSYLEKALNDPMDAEILANDFSAELVKLLQHPASFDFEFKTLDDYVNIIQSEDKHLRVYSWYHSIGGTWHDIVSYAQIKTASGVQLLQLHSGDEAISGAFSDATCFKIQQLKLNANMTYILSSWGSHGSGNKHQIMRAFTIAEEKLIEAEALFNGKKQLVIEGPRAIEISLVLDEKNKSISYEYFLYNDKIGFYETKNSVIEKLKWNGKVFEKVE